MYILFYSKSKGRNQTLQQLIKELLETYRTTMADILQDQSLFTNFLEVAAQHYKHSVFNQTMIYLFAPDAHMVANEKTWAQVGGMLKTKKPILSVRAEDNQIMLEKLYTERELRKLPPALAPYLKNWAAVDAAGMYKQATGHDILTDLQQLASDVYTSHGIGTETNLSQNTCAGLAEYITGRKLGIIDRGDYSKEFYLEAVERGRFFGKAFQWVNLSVKSTYGYFNKTLNDTTLKEAQYERTTKEPIQYGDIWQDGTGILGGKRAGRSGGYVNGGQLTFDDIRLGGGAGRADAFPENSKEIKPPERNRTMPEKQPHTGDADILSDRKRSEGRSEHAAHPTDAGDSATGEGASPGILPGSITVTGGESSNPDPNSYGGAKTKYRNNIRAVRMLLNVEAGNRQPTETERRIMQKYTGWGGIPQVFEGGREGWEKEHAELKSLLTDEEYKQARRSTLNAHYTPAGIIQTIFAAADNFGFRGGKILDPSAGNGRFFAELPEHWYKDLFAVELDNISGRLTNAIYPEANVQIKGYQDTLFPDNYFDGIISNVPFGNYGVADERYNKHKWSIHEYFFGKSLDKVKPGGIIAFITSKYLMDKKDNTFRKYVAQRAEFLGAVRLPSKAFYSIANTEVTTDVIFLKKREQELVWEKEWIHLGLTATGVPVNEYYLDHPENMLGEMVFDRSMFGKETDTACINSEPDFDLDTAFKAAVWALSENRRVFVPVTPAPEPKNENQTMGPTAADTPAKEIPADPAVKNYTYAVVDGSLYYRENDSMVFQKITGKPLERVKGMVAIRAAFMDVIYCQTENKSSNELVAAQQKLNSLYDDFVKKNGYLSNKANEVAFREDVDLPLLQSLEKAVSKTEYVKTDIFTKHTIQPPQTPEIHTALDALAFSLNQYGVVNLALMAEVYKKSIDEIVQELGDRLFFDPETESHQTAEEYLSGNVREKLDYLRQMLDKYPELKRNETALEKVQPARLGIADISFQLATPWVPLDYKLRYLKELLQISDTRFNMLSVEYDKPSTRYSIKGKETCAVMYSVNAREVYGTKRRSALTIFEDCLNSQVSSVFDTVIKDDKEKRVLNPQETQLARTKQAALQAEFVSWVQNTPDVLEKLEDIYNDTYNIYVPRKYDGSFLTIPGMANIVKLRPHQLDAVARIVFGGNSLLAHEVGSGKTYTMAAAAMLGKHIGLFHKPVFVIPNHMIDQWTREFYTIFPGANLLVTTKRDFEKSNRMRFISRIATGAYDAVIMTFTQFERIPMSPEYRKELIQQEINEITVALSESSERSYSVKRLEKTRASLEEKLEKLSSASAKDETLYFEQLGVQQLFIDEAHYYKNCFVHTKIQNVAGLGNSSAGKASDLLMKAKYINERTNYRGLVFATGTPITNSISELFVLQRYLQYNRLIEAGMGHFDEWAGVYTKIENVLEIAPEGTGFRDRTRFTSFDNLPELMTLFHLVADVKLVEDLDIQRPDIVGGKPETVMVPSSGYVEQYIGKLAERAEAVRGGGVDPREDNMLLITTSGRNVAIDPRLVDPAAPVNRDSKIYAACDNIARLHHQYNSDKALQLVFLDAGIPLYPVIKKDLVRQGVPEYEIAFIHDASSDKQKAELFEKCRNGDIRVLLGSTAKMGAGTNIQERMIALHDIDCPWRPADLEQRHGRILRQGNMFEKVHIFQYITQGTFDSYLFQTIENKQKLISQVMTNKSHARSCADVDESVLNYAEIKALAAGDPRIREKMELDNQVARLSLERQSYAAGQNRLKKVIEQAPAQIETLNQKVQAIEQDISTIKPPVNFSMNVGGVLYTKRSKAGEALDGLVRKLENGKTLVGGYAGMGISLIKNAFGSRLVLAAAHEYPISLGTSALGNIARIENVLDTLPAQRDSAFADLTAGQDRLAQAKEHFGKPFPKAGELNELLERQAALNFEIEMELKPKTNEHPEQDAPENGTAYDEYEFGE